MNCVRIYFSCSTEVYNIQNTQYSDTILVYCLLLNEGVQGVHVPSDCTSKCQPLDVCISKPFKGVLRNFWEDYVANTVINLPETEQQREIFKIPSPSRQDIVNWIAEGINYLKSHPEMVNSLKRS